MIYKELEKRVQEITIKYKNCKREKEDLEMKYKSIQNQFDNLSKQKGNYNFPKFNFYCEKHKKSFFYYCSKCKNNLCDECLTNHIYHEIISFSSININEKELNQYKHLIEEIEKNILKVNKILNNIKHLFDIIISIKNNEDIFKNDTKNNYIKYYIDYINTINEKIKIEEKNINLIQFNKNQIICNFIITKDQLDNPIQILNCYEEVKKNFQEIHGSNNEKELKKSCDIFYDDKKINFNFKCNFTKEENTIIIKFKKLLSNTNLMFYNCSSLQSLDLTNFNSYILSNMSYMFSGCTSLKILDLSNFNSKNVTNINNLFSYCYSLQVLNLDKFNTENVINMSNVFNNCSSLQYIDLSNFNTKNVSDFRGMFLNCSSLIDIDLSNFNTENAIDMSYMFSNCSSLKEINLSNFKTINVKNMEGMFQNCVSMITLDLSNFMTGNVNYMAKMFFNCSSLKTLNIENFNSENVNDFNDIFKGLNSQCEIITKDQNLAKLLENSCLIF